MLYDHPCRTTRAARPIDQDHINLLIWYWGRRGGGARYTLKLAESLAEIGELRCHLSLARDNELMSAFRQLRLPTHEVATYTTTTQFVASLPRLPNLRDSLARYIRQRNIDVVLHTMPHALSNLLVGAARIDSTRLVTVIHDAAPHPGDPAHFWRQRMRHLVRYSDKLVVLSEFVAQQLVAGYGVATDTIVVAPHGPISMGGERSRRCLPADRPFRFLFLGRFQRYKGLDLLCDSFAALRAHRSDVELHIVGDGDLRPYARAVRQPGITVDNRWIAECELDRRLAQAHCLVLPYREASQSGVVSLAAGTGLPAIITPVGGLGEQIRHGVNGLQANDVSSRAVSEQMRAILDPVIYETVSAGAAERQTGSTSWRQIAHVFHQAIRGVR